MATRIYLVRNNQTGEEKLVEATLPAQVIRHVAKSLFAIEPVKQGKLVELLLAGQKPEKASESDDDKPQAGATGADATSGAGSTDAIGVSGADTPEGGAQAGDDSATTLGEGAVQPQEQPQEGFQADAGTEVATTSKRRR